MAKSGAKKVKERSNVAYIQKLVKRSGAHARGAVTIELNRMLTFLIDRLTDDMGTITKTYAKMDDTIKPKLVNAALQSILTGKLRDAACDQATTSLVSFLDRNKVKSKRAAKTSAADAAVEVEAAEA